MSARITTQSILPPAMLCSTTKKYLAVPHNKFFELGTAYAAASVLDVTVSEWGTVASMVADDKYCDRACRLRLLLPTDASHTLTMSKFKLHQSTQALHDTQASSSHSVHKQSHMFWRLPSHIHPSCSMVRYTYIPVIR